MDKFYRPDPGAENGFMGRLEQGRRELSALLKRDVSMSEIAARAHMTGAALSNHKKKGSLPTRENVRALAKVFQDAGLMRFTANYLEEGHGTITVPQELVPKEPAAKRASRVVPEDPAERKKKRKA